MTESQQQEIGRLIAEGFTSGRLDDEDGTSTAWELKINQWNDNEPECAKCGVSMAGDDEKLLQEHEGKMYCPDCLCSYCKTLEHGTSGHDTSGCSLNHDHMAQSSQCVTHN